MVEADLYAVGEGTAINAAINLVVVYPQGNDRGLSLLVAFQKHVHQEGR